MRPRRAGTRTRAGASRAGALPRQQAPYSPSRPRLTAATRLSPSLSLTTRRRSEFLNAWLYLSSWTGAASLDQYARVLMAPQLAGAPPPGAGAFADGAGATAAAAAAAGGAAAPRPVQRVMNALAVDVAGILCVVARSDEARRAFREQVLGIEGVLVACLGHASLRPRAQAVRLLNALYDGVDWQLVEPLVPVIAYVGDEFCVDVFTTDDINELYGGGNGESDGDGAEGGGDSGAAPVFRVLVSAPPFGYVGAGGAAPQIGLPDASELDGEGEQQQGEAARPGAPEAVLTMHVPSVEREDAWVHAQPAESADAAPGNGAGAGAGSAGSPPSPGDIAPAAGSGNLRIDVGGGGAAPAPPSAPPRAPPHLVRVNGTRIRLRLSPFARCGFVDWRVVVVLRDGSTRPVTAEPTFAPPPRAAAAGAAASSHAADAAGAGAGAPLHFSLVLSPTSASASTSSAGALGEAAGGAAGGSGGASSPSSSAIFPAGSPIVSPRTASRRSGSIGSMSPSAQAAAERSGSASVGGNGAGGGAGFAAQQLQHLQVG